MTAINKVFEEIASQFKSKEIVKVEKKQNFAFPTITYPITNVRKISFNTQELSILFDKARNSEFIRHNNCMLFPLEYFKGDNVVDIAQDNDLLYSFVFSCWEKMYEYLSYSETTFYTSEAQSTKIQKLWKELKISIASYYRNPNDRSSSLDPYQFSAEFFEIEKAKHLLKDNFMNFIDCVVEEMNKKFKTNVLFFVFIEYCQFEFFKKLQHNNIVYLFT